MTNLAVQVLNLLASILLLLTFAMLSQRRIRVHIDLREDDLVPRGRLPVEHWAECLARPAPLRPEVDDDGRLVRALQDIGVEGLVGDVHWPRTESR